MSQQCALTAKVASASWAVLTGAFLVDYAPLPGIRPSLEYFILFWTFCMGKIPASSAERE